MNELERWVFREDGAWEVVEGGRWVYIDDYNELTKELEALRGRAKKAFWAGYEDAKLHPHLSNIQKAWERYKAQQGEANDT
jgi:hypothetical protein